MGFQTPKYKLARLLEQVDDGTIQLPDFQRGYKWDDERIRSLLVTITLGYPLGVIMLLETGSDHVRFKPKPIEGAPVTTAKAEPDLLLLDGQQRLTSLYQSMSGDGVVNTKDVRGKQLQRRYYIDMAKVLTDHNERDEPSSRYRPTARSGPTSVRMSNSMCLRGEGAGARLLPIPAGLRSNRGYLVAVRPS